MILHLALLALVQQQVPAADPAYLFFVTSTGSDEVAMVRFAGKGLTIVHRTLIRLMPGDAATPGELYSDTTGRTFALSSAHGLDATALATGPRYITVAPDGKSYLVTSEHGVPTSELVHVRIAADTSVGGQPPDTIVGREPLAPIPGAIDATGDGYAWVAGSRGDTAASWIAVVYLTGMVEVARIPTCRGAVGSQFNPDRTLHYSLCGPDDLLVETDVSTLQVTRRIPLGGASRCAPAALAVSHDGRHVYVACSAGNDVLVVDAQSGAVERRIAVNAHAGALAASPDARWLVITLPEANAFSLVDVSGGRPPLRISARHVAPTGVTISADSRYAFASFAGGDPLTKPSGMEVVELATQSVVASLDYGRRLGGIAFWKGAH